MSRHSESPFKLPILSGALLALSYAGVPPLVPNFVAFLPILWWLDDNAALPRADRLRGAFLFGAVTYFGILYWMYSMLRWSWLAGLLYVGLASAFALFAMTAVTIAARIRLALGWSWAIALPAPWLALEWSRTFTDVRMTADHLGHTLAAFPFLVQFADLVGPYGVGAFMLVANALLYEAVRRRGAASGRKAAIALAILVPAVLAYDAWAWLHPPDAVRTVKIGHVQPNVPLDVKHGYKTEEEQWRTLADLTREAARRGAEIVVWPETAVPWQLHHVVAQPATLAMPRLQALARETRADIVAGVEYFRITEPSKSAFYNAALLVHPDGTIDPAWSAKIYLVPFVEGVPFEPILGPIVEGRSGDTSRWLAGGFARGPGLVALPAAKARIGTLICYEELYFDLTRRLRNSGAEVIAILTNDAWFGTTRFQWYQANTVRLRAIENRCSFVRAANSGISGFVDPLGRYHGWTGLDVEAVGVEDLPVTVKRSVYGAIGDVVAWLAAALAIAGMVLSRRAGARRPGRVEAVMSWEMLDWNWETFRSRVPSEIETVLLPVGTVEAHGAIPLGTDVFIPEALARELAPRLRALVAPAVPYGVTNTLLPYPGSTTISSPTFVSYLFEAAAGLADAGFRRIVLLNGHGGQSREVGEVVKRLWAEKRVFSAAIEWWGPADKLRTGIYGDVVSGHAGVGETALILAISPEKVDAARATTIRRAPVRDGVQARPFPASIILEHEETHGEGAPVLDPEKARRYFAVTVDAVEKTIREVFEGWAELEKR